MIEAAKMYEASPEGLRLRWMNILYELGQQSQTNTIMLVPAVYAGSRLASSWNLRLQRSNHGTTSSGSKEETNTQTKNLAATMNNLSKQDFFFLFRFGQSKYLGCFYCFHRALQQKLSCFLAWPTA